MSVQDIFWNDGRFAVVLQVNVEDVASSAVDVTGHGETLAAGHQQSDARIAAAEAGWQGSSAAALAARLDAWMSGHAQGLQDAAIRFTSFEEGRVQVMEAVAADGDAAAPTAE